MIMCTANISQENRASTKKTLQRSPQPLSPQMLAGQARSTASAGANEAAVAERDRRRLRSSTLPRGARRQILGCFSSWHKIVNSYPGRAAVAAVAHVEPHVGHRRAAAAAAVEFRTSPVGIGSQGAVSSTRGGGSSVRPAYRFQFPAALFWAGVRHFQRESRRELGFVNVRLVCVCVCVLSFCLCLFVWLSISHGYTAKVCELFHKPIYHASRAHEKLPSSGRNGARDG